MKALTFRVLPNTSLLFRRMTPPGPVVTRICQCLVLAFRTITGYYISDLHATCFLLECLFLVCGLTLLYLTGITDDLIGVRYRQKFVIQILCACFFLSQSFG